MSNDFEIHSLSNLTEPELWKAVYILKDKVESEIEYRKECAEKETYFYSKVTQAAVQSEIKDLEGEH